LIPKVDPLFIPFGVYDDVATLLKSGYFYPCMLTGLSGCGKTEMIKHICATAKREYYRLNITFETNEDDMIGGMRLKDGNTVVEKGPVLAAMEAGGVLLLDEVDLASPMLIMCLQSILEGEGYLMKKTGEWVVPKPGFQIFATANTKGTGDASGSFVGTQVLNEAFLERFPSTFECSYPDKETEKKILTNVAKHYNIENTANLIKALVEFAGDARKSYENGMIEHTISTRRLVQIIKAVGIWKDIDKAVSICFSRFDAGTRDGFLDTFKIRFDAIEGTIDDGKSEDGKDVLGSWNAW
jgi:MoxR-like ATPase